MSLTHLVPDLASGGGLAAYAAALQLPDQRLIDPTGFRRQPPPAGPLLLHCSGYGYARNGAPAALVAELLAWRNATPSRRLLVVFHELVVRQPPWRKGFWWAPWQGQVMRRLGRGADGCFTTLERHRRWLRRQAIEPATVLAVPSNVGELDQPPPLAGRQPRLVVFGGPAQRRAAYRALQPHAPLLLALGLEAIDDIGPPLAAPPRLPLPWQQHGHLPAAAVSERLAAAAVAAVAYPLDYLAKSGIFAAIAAHGALPLLLNPGRSWPPARPPAPADGLACGRQLLTPATATQIAIDPLAKNLLSPCRSETAQAIATAAWTWYQPHRLSEQRRWLMAWLATS